jgi:hypothetical protein
MISSVVNVEELYINKIICENYKFDKKKGWSKPPFLCKQTSKIN